MKKIIEGMKEHFKGFKEGFKYGLNKALDEVWRA